MKFCKLFILMSFISCVFFVSCNDVEVNDFIIEDEIEGFKPSPFDPDLFDDVTFPEIDLSSFYQETHADASASRCAEYEAAKDRFRAIAQNCEFDEAYCAYLYVFRGLSIWIYQQDCIPDTFCERCDGYLITANELNNELIDAGIHPLYTNDIQILIERLELQCSEC